MNKCLLLFKHPLKFTALIQQPNKKITVNTSEVYGEGMLVRPFSYFNNNEYNIYFYVPDLPFSHWFLNWHLFKVTQFVRNAPSVYSIKYSHGFLIRNQINSHLILLLNTVSIKFIITVKIDVEPHTILQFKFINEHFNKIWRKGRVVWKIIISSAGSTSK